jgi:hypothetical protein
MNRKIKDTENICLSRIRHTAWEMGANAIVGLDLDYSEVGSLRGMMLICCTGTAIRVTNTDILADETNEALRDMSLKTEELSRLKGLAKAYEKFNDTF